MWSSSASTAPTTCVRCSTSSDPGRTAAVGVLLDHLVAGTKGARLAHEIAHAGVLVTGTPYVDVWQAVRPKAVGIPAWPSVPKGVDWKTGVCAALGVDDPRLLAPDPRVGRELERPRAAARPSGRGAHRLRHRRHADPATSMLGRVDDFGELDATAQARARPPQGRHAARTASKPRSHASRRSTRS